MKNIWTFLGIKITTIISESLILYAILYVGIKGWQYLIFDRNLSLGWVTQNNHQETAKVSTDLIFVGMTLFSLIPAVVVCIVLFLVDQKLGLRKIFQVLLMTFYPFIFFGAIGLAIQYERMYPSPGVFDMPVIFLVWPIVFMKKLNQGVYTQLINSVTREDTRFQQENEIVYLRAHPWVKVDLSRYSSTTFPLVNLGIFTLISGLTVVGTIASVIKNPTENWVVGTLLLGLVVWGVWIRKGQTMATMKRFNMKVRK